MCNLQAVHCDIIVYCQGCTDIPGSDPHHEGELHLVGELHLLGKLHHRDGLVVVVGFY